MASVNESTSKSKTIRKLGNICSLPFCSKTLQNGVSMHVNPSDTKTRKLWLDFVGKTREDAHLLKNVFVCSDHFVASDYSNHLAASEQHGTENVKFRRVLRKGSIPSVYPVPTLDQLDRVKKHYDAKGLPSQLLRSAADVANRNVRKSKRQRAAKKRIANRELSMNNDNQPAGCSSEEESTVNSHLEDAITRNESSNFVECHSQTAINWFDSEDVGTGNSMSGTVHHRSNEDVVNSSLSIQIKCEPDLELDHDEEVPDQRMTFDACQVKSEAPDKFEENMVDSPLNIQIKCEPESESDHEEEILDNQITFEAYQVKAENPDNSEDEIDDYSDATANEEKRFVCTECHKRFSYKCTLKKHLLTHTGEKPFVCSQCGKRFLDRCNLKQHLLTHSGDKPYQCSNCDKSFTQRSNLKKHFTTHTGEKPFSCSQCEMRFTQKSNLKKHLSIHAGEEQFSCSQCKKRILHRSDLKKHTLMHTGEKLLMCSDCHQASNQKMHLNQHSSTYSVNKPFSCSRCGQKFAQKSNLEKHLLTHAEEKTFQCNECEQKFQSIALLKAHILIHNTTKLFQCSEVN